MAFQAAYAIGLVLSGSIIDKIGTKLGYLVAVIWWSAAGVLTAAATSTFGFGAFRALLGLGEGGNFPALSRVWLNGFLKKNVLWQRVFLTLVLISVLW
jgi:ACS family hexuronate transporter-like MFS transporter